MPHSSFKRTAQMKGGNSWKSYFVIADPTKSADNIHFLTLVTEPPVLSCRSLTPLLHADILICSSSIYFSLNSSSKLYGASLNFHYILTTCAIIICLPIYSTSTQGNKARKLVNFFLPLTLFIYCGVLL